MAAADGRAPRRRRGAGRRLRLAVVSALALLLVVPGAVATRSIWTDSLDEERPDAAPSRVAQASAPAVLEKGEADGQHWSLGVYDAAQGRCLQLRVFETEASGLTMCGSIVPARFAFQVQVVQLAARSIVFGDLDPRIAKVGIRVGDAEPVVVAARDPDEKLLRRSGTRGGWRYYVAALPGAIDATRVQVTAYDADGAVVPRFP